ncbi:tetratricopeptide repeat protein [Vibrio hepatarius]|uniref:tetratricopeptide repeat protein n=1 Tax=Vibrio hepatarius TaxID=171383 RepID=UPI001C0920A7|nr:hypothetical protein [Vibrio hepatarius]MBU2896209.1 hypothetical protein [Vibrio hepatarius]
MLKLYAVFIIIFFSGCATQGSDTDLKNRESIMISAQNYQGLVDLYTESVKKNDSAENREKLAHYYFLLDDYEASAYQLENVIKRKSAQAETFYNQSINYYMLDKLIIAETMINRAIEMKPNNAKFRNQKGIVLAQKSEFESAIREFEKARSLIFPDVKIKNNLALIYYKKGEYTKAITTLMPLYLRNNNNKKIVANLIVIMAKMNDRNYVLNLLRDKYDMDNSEAVYVYNRLSR